MHKKAARRIFLPGSVRNHFRKTVPSSADKAYGYPDASGTVSDECRFYYLLHDFEGEGDEVLQKQADWHLGLDYYEYYYKEACISFDFDENGGVAAIAIDTKSRMFW